MEALHEADRAGGPPPEKRRRLMTKDNCLQPVVLTYEDEKDSVLDYLRAVAHNIKLA